MNFVIYCSTKRFSESAVWLPASIKQNYLKLTLLLSSYFLQLKILAGMIWLRSAKKLNCVIVKSLCE
ncbi:hypothetical protein EAY01_19360, partial [Vibrio anguillarum]|nr:hypothetical protein [Vibrio anguillarum]